MNGKQQEITESVERILENVTVTGNVVQGVAVLGPRSDNGPPGGRHYTQQARGDVAELSEGAQVFLDHPENKSRGRVRSVNDLIGVLRNVRESGDRVRGDFVLVDHVDKLKRLAEQAPKAAGLSIRARGDVRRDGDREIVESVSKIKSVDLVSRPAATEGLAESLIESIQQEETMKRDVRETDLSQVDDRLFGGTPYDERPWADRLRKMREQAEQEESVGEKHGDISEADLGRIEMNLFC